jgi:hypothetical protein
MGTLWRIVVMAGAIWFCAALVASASAEATSRTNTSGTAEITFLGQATDGTHVRITEQLSDVGLSHLSPLNQATATPGKAFLSFYGPGGTSDNTRPAFDGISGVDTSAVHLVLADHAVVPAQQSGSDLGSLLLGTYVFLVPSSTKTATLGVSSGSYGAVEYQNGTGAGGSLTTIAFEPAKTLLVVPAPIRTAPGGGTTTTTARARSSEARHTPVHKSTGSGVGFAAPLAVGAGTGGGAVLLVLLIPIWRRRAYRKADAEGRVIIDSAPILLSPRVPAVLETRETRPIDQPVTDHPPDAGRAIERVKSPSVTIKVLGPVEIAGLVHSIKLGSVRDVLVFLALHPGRSFTSAELRNAIWAGRRDEPKPETFRNYMSHLRRALPDGVLKKDGYRYSLTNGIDSDWATFCALVAGSDDQAERLAEALSLVRGAPFDGPSTGRSVSFGWADELRRSMEVAVERAAHELFTIGIETGDMALADVGVSQALTGIPGSLVALEDRLRLGSAIGGRIEVARRMRSARSVLRDVICQPHGTT